MKCKNCNAKLNINDTVCKNCNKVISIFQSVNIQGKKSKINIIKFLFIALLVINLLLLSTTNIRAYLGYTNEIKFKNIKITYPVNWRSKVKNSELNLRSLNNKINIEIISEKKLNQLEDKINKNRVLVRSEYKTKDVSWAKVIFLTDLQNEIKYNVNYYALYKGDLYIIEASKKSEKDLKQTINLIEKII